MNVFRKLATWVTGAGLRFLGVLSPGLAIPVFARTKAMKISAVYRCVDVISDSVAQLPLTLYRLDEKDYKYRFKTHPTYRLLGYEPSPGVTRFTLMKLLVSSMLLHGNGYAWIDRDDEGNATGLYFIPSSLVSVVFVSDHGGGRVKRYQVAGFPALVEPHDMLHVMNFSNDGITGVSTLEHAESATSLAYYAENNAIQFFKGGSNVRGYLTTKGPSLNKEQREQIRSQWAEGMNVEEGTQRGIPVLSGDLAYVPVTVDPIKSQLLESRQHSVIDICRFFGVSPVKAFDFSKSSYSTVEATQLAFLTDTLAPLLEKIELEILIKLYKPSEVARLEVKFDTSAILRADKQAQANYMRAAVQSAVITPNEWRREMGFEPLPDGDKAMIQVNMQTLENAVKEKDKESDKEKIKLPA